MNDEATERDRRPRRWRPRRIVRLLFLLMVVGAVGLAYFATRPSRLAHVAENMLADVTGAEVQVRGAWIDVDGTVELQGVRFRLPDTTGRGARLFRCPRVLLEVSPWDLLFGWSGGGRLVLLRPVLSLTELDGPRRRFNYQRLGALKSPALRSLRHTERYRRLPRIYVRHGHIRYGQIVDGDYRGVGRMQVSGRLLPDEGDPHAYRFELYESGSDSAGMGPGPMLGGRLDLKDMRVSAELANFAFVDPHRNMLPRRIRQWWDRFDPSGNLENIRFDYDPETGPEGRVTVEGVSLTLPQLSVGDYRARMRDVRGTFRFDADRIRIEKLVGRIAGLTYRVDGTIHGYSADAPFHLALNTPRPFRIPETPRYLVAMPLPVQKVFRQLTPVGWLRVSMSLRRRQSGGPIDYEGTARILSGRRVLAALAGPGRRPERLRRLEGLEPDSPKLVSKGMYHKFEYPLTDCHGLIRFNTQRIRVEHLTGNTPGGGTATITGTIGPPGRENPGVDLEITAVDIPFDRKLKEALPPPQREALRMFFHKPSYDRLRRAGHFASEAQRRQDRRRQRDLERRLRARPANGEPKRDTLHEKLSSLKERLKRPVFDLGGRGDVLIDIERSVGSEGDPVIRTSIDLSETRVVFKHFPYPIRVHSGTVKTGPDRVAFETVGGKGLTGGVGVLDGRIELVGPEESKKLVPNLRLHAEHVPINALLTDAMPKRQARWVRQLELDGQLEVSGRIFRNDDDRIDIDMGLALSDGTMRPGGGGYRLDDVTGKMRLSLSRLKIESLKGARGDARLSLSGVTAFPEEGERRIELRAEATGMRFETPVLDLIGPMVENEHALRNFWSKHEPAGAFNATAEYRAVGDRQPAYRLELRPQSLRFTRDGTRYKLTDTDGAVVVQPGRVDLERLSGRFAAAHLRVSGTFELAERSRAQLAVTASGERFGQTARRLVPDRARSTVEAIQPEGRFTLRIPELTLQAGAKKGVEVNQANGTLSFNDASADLGLPVGKFDGEARFRINAAKGDRPVRIGVDVSAQRFTLAGRLVRDLRMSLGNTDGEGRIAIPSIEARCADGRIAGSGLLDFEAGRFRMDLAMNGARIGPLLDKGDGASPAASGGGQAATSTDGLKGRVAASLGLEGSWTGRADWRGRGRVRVRQADLSGLPLAMGLLHISHLKLPGENHFSRADLRYYLDGERIVFERIRLDSSTLRLAGGGTVRYPQRKVNLTLTTSNPTGLRLGPLTRFVNGVRNQLVTVRVTGTVDDPAVDVRQLRGFAEAWRDVFGPTAEPSPLPGQGG